MVRALWCSTQAKIFWFYILFLFHILSLVQRITKLDTSGLCVSYKRMDSISTHVGTL